MILFFYPAVIFAFCSLSIVLGFLLNRRALVYYGIILPCFTGSPFLTFTRGAAGAITAADLVSCTLFVCLALGLHRNWIAPKAPDWYKAAKAFLCVGLIEVMWIGPLYNWVVGNVSGALSSRTTEIASISMPILIGAFYAMKLLSVAVYAYFFCHIKTEWSDVECVIDAVMLTGGILAVGIILTHLNVVDLRLALPDEKAYQGVNVFGLNRAPMGRFCIFGLALCIGRLRKSTNAVSTAGFALLLILGVLFSGSRGAALAGCVTLVVLAVLGRIKGLMVGIAVVGVCLLGVGVAASLDEEVLDRFVDSLQAGNLAEAGGRPAIWRKTVEYLIENPLVIVTGVGPFNYKYVTQRGEYPEHAHNDYLTCITEMGLAGALFLLSTLLLLIRTLMKSRSLPSRGERWVYTSLICMLCGLMVAGFFEQTLYWAVADLPVYRIYLAVFSSVSMYLVGKNHSQTSGRTAGRRGTPAAGYQTGENSESCCGATIATRRFIRIGASG